jgi:hypothetical protein
MTSSRHNSATAINRQADTLEMSVDAMPINLA